MAQQLFFKLPNLKRGHGWGFLALAVLALSLSAAPAPAYAAHGAGSDRQETKSPKVTKERTAAIDDVETTSSVQSDANTACSTARRRLFVESEGWIVRRVTTCY